MTADIHTLTGAYAVDALDDEERQHFESHLEECSACRREVEELQATAAQLGAASYETPPTDLKASVLAEIDRTRQLPPLPREEPEEPEGTAAVASGTATVVSLPTPWYQRLLAPAAAILTVVAIGQAVVISQMNDRMDVLEASTMDRDLLAAADLMTVTVEGPSGARARVLASPTMGEGMFVVHGMSAPPSDQDYQLWLITAEGAEPAGIVEIVNGAGWQPLTTSMDGVIALGVTMEPAGGSPQPTSDPLMVVEMPADA